jgi:hypothetical protein
MVETAATGARESRRWRGRRYATGVSRWFGGCCGRSSMVELQPSKLVMRVRFPSPAPGIYPRVSGCSPLRLRGGCGARSIVHATHVPHVYTARGPVTRGQAKNCVMPGRRRAADYLTSRVKRGAAVRRRWRALHRAPACGPTARLLTGGEDSRRGVGDPLRRGCQRRRTLSACSSFAGSSPYTATTLGWPAVAA